MNLVTRDSSSLFLRVMVLGTMAPRDRVARVGNREKRGERKRKGVALDRKRRFHSSPLASSAYHFRCIPCLIFPVALLTVKKRAPFWNRSIKPSENIETGGPVKKGITTSFVVRPISTISRIVWESGKS